MRVAPSADICSEAGGFLRSPSPRLVSTQTHSVVKNRIDNRPRSLYYILANELQFVPVHGIRQKTFIPVLLRFVFDSSLKM